VGTVTVTANQAGNINYNAATETAISFEVIDSSNPCANFNVVLTSSIDNVCLGGADGSIDITVSGGSGSYSYSWSNGATTEDVSGLSASTHTVTVTDNTHGCSATLDVTITEPSAGIAITSTSTDVVAGNDGAADITVTGGTMPYTYSWSNGATSEDLTGVSAGSYTVTVTDANGCSVSQTVEVGDVITGVEGVTATTLQIYPNPVSDYLTLEGAFSGQDVEVRVVNTEGKQLLTTRFENVTSNTVSLELNTLKDGQYLVIVNTNSEQIVHRISIKH